MNKELCMPIVLQRLASFGYSNRPEDVWVLDFIYDKVEQEIQIRINSKEVPVDLKTIMIDKICGDFLSQKKNMGMILDKEFESIVKSLSEGGVSYTFQDGLTPEQRFDIAMSKLCEMDIANLARFRKLVW